MKAGEETALLEEKFRRSNSLTIGHPETERGENLQTIQYIFSQLEDMNCQIRVQKCTAQQFIMDLHQDIHHFKITEQSQAEERGKREKGHIQRIKIIRSILHFYSSNITVRK